MKALRGCVVKGCAVIAILSLVAILGLGVLSYLYNVPWSGLGEFVNAKGEVERAKTLWHWMDLFLVPGLIAVGGIIINHTINRSEKQRAEKQEQLERIRLDKQAEAEKQFATGRLHQQALENYLDHMAELIIKYQQIDGTYEDSTITIMRARTVTVLRGLDGERKGSIIRFLREAGLLAYISLKDADLSSVNLKRFDLVGNEWQSMYLDDSYLEGANLARINLSRAELRRAVLNRANLNSAILVRADLSHAQLTETTFVGAKLERAVLDHANLQGADLTSAILTEASLRGTNLKHAQVSEEQLKLTIWDKHTIWPDGRTYEPPEGHEYNIPVIPPTNSTIHVDSLNSPADFPK